MDLSKERAEHITLAIIGFFISLLYMLIIFVLLSSARLREIKSNQLLLNLSIGHTLTGLSHFAGMWTTFRVGKVVFVAGVYAYLSLAVLTIDRCIYILKPFRYERLHRGWHILCMAISPVLALILFAFYVHSGLNNPVHLDTMSTLPFVFLIFLLIGLLLIPSFIVFRIARRQRNRIVSLRVALSNGTVRGTSKMNDIRSFYASFGCVTTFALLWLPHLILRIWEIASGVQVRYTYVAITAIIATLNPFSDAVISVWFNKDLKTRLKNVLRKPCS